jgi:hypothetical protein
MERFLISLKTERLNNITFINHASVNGVSNGSIYLTDEIAPMFIFIQKNIGAK